MKKPYIEVSELKVDDAMEMALIMHPSQGEVLRPHEQEHFLAGHRPRIKGAFLLNWEGPRIPFGAQVAETEVAWIENGYAKSRDEEVVGIYRRLVKFGGPSGRQHTMIVFTM